MTDDSEVMWHVNIPAPRVFFHHPSIFGDLLHVVPPHLDAIFYATYLVARRHIEGLELLTEDRRLAEAAGEP